MTRQEYGERCIDIVGVMRVAAAEDATLSVFLEMFGLLTEPKLEDTNG